MRPRSPSDTSPIPPSDGQAPSDVGDRAFRDSAEAFRLIADTTSEVLWIAKMDGSRVVYVSPAYERLWGRSCESLYRDPRSFLQAIHPDDLEHVLEDHAKGGTAFDHEYRILRPDGSVRWIWGRGWPVRGEDGEILHHVGVAQDITERKRAEIERAAVAERFHLVARATNDGIWDWDMATNEVWWSETYHQTFGCERGAKPSFEIWADRIHPEDRARVIESFTEAMARRAAAWTAEYRYLKADGTVLDVLDRAYVLHDASGKPVRILGALMDMTERKRAVSALRESEERFRATFEQAAVGVAHVALDGRFLRVNQKLCDITGYGRDELTMKHFQIVTFAEDAADDQRFMEMLLRGEGQTHTGQKRLLRKDGSPVWIEVTSSVVRTPSGAPDYFMAVVVDISERRSIETQLRLAQKMEAIGVLAGGVAHDFNNMLQAIILDAELAGLNLGTPSTVAECLRNIKATADRAGTLARQLLLFSRREVMQRQHLDINAAVTNLGAMLERILGEDIRIELHLAPDVGRVHADPGMIDQVLMNLAVNARDAMPRGGALTIETRLFSLEEGDPRLRHAGASREYVRVGVRDTGCGIPADVLPRIFEPFFTTKEPGRGTGLGLATVFGIVDQHSGWTDVESELGRGTEFSVFLPSHPSDRRRRLALTRPDARFGGETILLVEDDDIVRASLRAILAHYGYSVVEATTGPEALQRWDEIDGKVDLVLTDLVMPGGMDGRELAAKLVARRPGLCVVYASGHSGGLAGRDLPLRHNERFVPKPVTADRLLDTLRTCLES